MVGVATVGGDESCGPLEPWLAKTTTRTMRAATTSAATTQPAQLVRFGIGGRWPSRLPAEVAPRGGVAPGGTGRGTHGVGPPTGAGAGALPGIGGPTGVASRFAIAGGGGGRNPPLPPLPPLPPVPPRP